MFLLKVQKLYFYFYFVYVVVVVVVQAKSRCFEKSLEYPLPNAFPFLYQPPVSNEEPYQTRAPQNRKEGTMQDAISPAYKCRHEELNANNLCSSNIHSFNLQTNLLIAKDALKSSSVNQSSIIYNDNSLIHMATILENVSDLKSFEETKESFQITDAYGKTPLHYAAILGNLDLVEIIVDNDIDINRSDAEGNTAIHLAALNGHFDVIRYLDSMQGTKLDLKNADGESPLHLAATGGHLNVIRFLINRGVSADVADHNGYTPLRRSLFNNHWNVSLALLDRWASIESVESDSFTMLHSASYHGLIHIVKFLVEKGSNVKTVTVFRETALHFAASENSYEVVVYLIVNGAEPGAISQNGETPLHLAAARGLPKIVDILLKQFNSSSGIANVRNVDGNSALHLASKGGTGEALQTWLKYGGQLSGEFKERYLKVIDLLIEEGNADLEIENKGKSTPIHLASDAGNLYIVEKLVQLGANPSVKDRNGNNAFQAAAAKGFQEIVSFFIRNNNNQLLLETDNNGRTALHFSAYFNEESAVRILLANGADVNAKDKRGMQPIHYAAFNGHNSLVHFLINAGKANVSARDNIGRVPLHLGLWSLTPIIITHVFIDELGEDLEAVDIYGLTPLAMSTYFNGYDIANYLINKSANLETRDLCGRTPLHLATIRNNIEIVKLLVENGAKVNVKDFQSNTPVQLASKFGHVNLVDYLSTNEVEIQEEESEDYYHIYDSSEINEQDLISEDFPMPATLVQDDQIINISPTTIATPLPTSSTVQPQTINNKDPIQEMKNIVTLHKASFNGNVEIVQQLLNEGTSIVNRQDKHGNTPLHLAAMTGSQSVVETLVANGASLNSVDNDGDTPLHLGARYGHLKTVEYLVRAGANFHVENIYGQTAVDYAAKTRQYQIVNFLNSYTEDVI